MPSLLVRWELNEFWWNLIHEPHAVGRAAKHVSGTMHIPGANDQQDRFAVSAADLERDLCLG
jgi:hypothetical protein